ncbi:MAG: hypothetical protein ACI4IN_04855, partial [Eubacterium sp.]
DHYGTNLFAYCCNDPVNKVDYDGCKAKKYNTTSIFDVFIRKHLLKGKKIHSYKDKNTIRYLKYRRVKYYPKSNSKKTETLYVKWGPKNYWKKYLKHEFSIVNMNITFDIEALFGSATNLGYSQGKGYFFDDPKDIGSLCGTLVSLGINISKAKRLYSYAKYCSSVWGNGKNEDCYMFVVTKDSKYNGGYMLSNRNTRWRKL